MENIKTPLCELAIKYGTDKFFAVNHYYTPFYYELLKDKRESFKKVLELGIGSPETMKHVKYYRAGASLRMWQEFFPKAQIYGADILPETMFAEDRIKTFLCDERKPEDLVKLVEQTGSDIDLFVDDANHDVRNQINTFKILMPLFKKEVIYVIEDVVHLNYAAKHLSGYDYYIPASMRLIVIKNKL